MYKNFRIDLHSTPHFLEDTKKNKYITALSPIIHDSKTQLKQNITSQNITKRLLSDNKTLSTHQNYNFPSQAQIAQLFENPTIAESQKNLFPSNKDIESTFTLLDSPKLKLIPTRVLRTTKNQKAKLNRHSSCSQNFFIPDEKVRNEVELINPEIVRKTKELKQKPPLETNMKKILIKSFNKTLQNFQQKSSLDLQFKSYKDRETQNYRDRDFQGDWYGKKIDAPFYTKTIVRSINQIKSQLNLQDPIMVHLSKTDIDHVLNKQPKILKGCIDRNEMLHLQNFVDLNDNINYERKKSIVDSLFLKKEFSTKDKEMLYQILNYQIQRYIVLQTRVDMLKREIRETKGITGTINKNVEQMRRLLVYLSENYDSLVK